MGRFDRRAVGRCARRGKSTQPRLCLVREDESAALRNSLCLGRHRLPVAVNPLNHED